MNETIQELLGLIKLQGEMISAHTRMIDSLSSRIELLENRLDEIDEHTESRTLSSAPESE